MKKILKTAVIGFGLAGRVFHCPMISSLDNFKLSKIYTTNKDRINDIGKLYPDAAAVSEVKDIFEDNTIELVVIAAPNTYHFSLAKEALLSGKHVVVDKPFTVTSKEADELIELAEKRSRILSVYQNRRWDSDFKTVKKVIDSGVLGNLVECEIHFDRYRYEAKDSWREDNIPGSGVLYDLGSHLIDQALVLFGPPKAVTADLRMQRQTSRNIDNFELILHYNSLKVTLKCGMLVRGDLPRYILLGEKGSFIKYGLDVQEEHLKAGYTPITKADWGEEPEDLYGTICTTFNGLDIKGRIKSEKGDYREFYKNIYDAVINEAPLAVTASQARNTIRLIEYAMESNEKRCTIDVSL